MEKFSKTKRGVLFIFLGAFIVAVISLILPKISSAQNDNLLPGNYEKNLNSIFDPLKNAPNQIKDDLNKLPSKLPPGVLGWLKDKWNIVWNAVGDWFYKTTGYTISQVFSAIIKFIIGLFEIVMKLLRWIWSLISKFI